MGLLDRNKRKPATVATPAAAAPMTATTPASSASPLASADANSLRDMLIASVAAGDSKLLASLANANRDAIAANFGEWQKVPEAIRNNGSVMQRYANTLIALAELFRDQFGDTSLIARLTAPGPAPDAMQVQWEQGLGQAEALAKELRFAEACELLQQILNALATVPRDTPVPYHAVTHGRLAHALFAMGKATEAADQMWEALQSSQQRSENSGIAAGLRGLFEIHRYMGKFAEAAGFAERLSAKLAQMENIPEADFWTRQAALTRAGEPLCRVVFFVNDQQYEIDDVPKLTEARLRYGYVRNRPPLGLCEGLVQRGMQLGAQAKFTEALAAFGEAATVDPYDPNPHYQSALTLMHLERPGDAVEEYDRTEELAPGWFNSRAERWVASEVAAGRLEQAIFFILRTEDMPESAASWEQKLSLVDQAITRVGEIPPLMLYRARCLMRLGRAAEAEPVLRSGLEKAQEPDVRTRLLVDLQMLVPDVDEKRRLLNEAVALNGNLASAGVARVSLKQLEA